MKLQPAETSTSSASQLHPPLRSRMVTVSFMSGHEGSLYKKGTWILTYLACNWCPQPCGLPGMNIAWLSRTVTFTERCGNAQQTSGSSSAQQAAQEVWEDSFDCGFRKAGRDKSLCPAHRQRCKCGPSFVFTWRWALWSRKGIRLWHEGCCAKLYRTVCAKPLQESFFLLMSYYCLFLPYQRNPLQPDWPAFFGCVFLFGFGFFVIGKYEPSKPFYRGAWSAQ